MRLSRLRTSVRAMMVAVVAVAVISWACTLSNTTYAPGYSEAMFDSLPVGTSKDEVLKLLGKPLVRFDWERGEEVWEYTERRFGWNYEQRWVTFGEDRLRWKRKYYQTD